IPSSRERRCPCATLSSTASGMLRIEPQLRDARDQAGRMRTPIELAQALELGRPQLEHDVLAQVALVPPRVGVPPRRDLREGAQSARQGLLQRAHLLWLERVSSAGPEREHERMTGQLAPG